jgi:small subunit ribosomal protein S1
LVEDQHELGQLVQGVVTNVADFGAFVQIEEGVEGLIHISELTEAPISHPRDVVRRGDLLLLRIIRIDPRRRRLGLSLKRVLESEWAEWAARLSAAESGRPVPAKKIQPRPHAEPASGSERPAAEAKRAEDERPTVLEPGVQAASLEEIEEPPLPSDEPNVPVQVADVAENGAIQS